MKCVELPNQASTLDYGDFTSKDLCGPDTVIFHAKYPCVGISCSISLASGSRDHFAPITRVNINTYVTAVQGAIEF